MKVKICGIKTYDEAMAAIEAGADYLGFNFYQSSPRYIRPAECLGLMVKLQLALQNYSQHVHIVGVFVNSSPADVRTIRDDCNLDLVQLSGDEPPELTAEYGPRAFKALRPTSAEDLAEAMRIYPQRSGAPAWLIDAYRLGEYGGTGQQADWSLARQAAAAAPIFLAGGLNPDNVAGAIRQVLPWGVDAASGVEQQPGVKDTQKMIAFIRAAKTALPVAGEENA